MPLFANYGQIVQAVFAGLSFILATILAYPALQQRGVVSFAGFVVLLLVVGLGTSVVVLVKGWNEYKVTLTVLDFSVDRNAAPLANYPLKIRAKFRNDSGQCIHLRRPTWLQESAVPAQRPLGCGLHKRQGGQWDNGDNDEVHLQSREETKIWVGIDRAFQEQDVYRRHETQTAGILAFLVKIGKKEQEIKIKV